MLRSPFRRLVAAVVPLALAASGLVAVAAVTAPPAAAAGGLINNGEQHQTYTRFAGNAGPTTAFSSPAVGDINGDGIPEIVTGGMDGCVRIMTLKAVMLRDCLYLPGGIQSSPTLVDWNGDGVKDIIASSTYGGVRGWDGNGNVIIDLPTAGTFATPAVGDIDGDGTLDLAVATWGQQVTVFRHNGSVMFSKFIYDTSFSSPALADLDGDGRLEVIVGADMDIGNGANNPPINLAPGGILWVFRADGTTLPGFPRNISDQVLWSSPAIADLNNDGSLDIVIGTGENWAGKGRWLYAVDRFGNALPGWPVSMPGATMGSPAIADLDGDGRLDVVEQSSDGSISYITRDGAVWKRWCARSQNQGCVPIAFDGQPSIGDINGDGTLDVVSLTEADLQVWSGKTGALEFTNPLPFWWAPGSQPTIASYGGDTYVVVVRTEEGNGNPGDRAVGDQQVTRVFRTGHAAGQLPWPMFHNNLRRTGTVLDEIPPTIGGGLTQPSSARTLMRIDWSGRDNETGVAGFDVDTRQDGQGWTAYVRHGGGHGRAGVTVAGARNLYGLPGHTYSVRARSWDAVGNVSAWRTLGSISIASGAQRSQPFRGAYAGSVFGPVSAISSPPVDGPSFPGALGRGIAASPDGGGYELDAFGGIHAFGGAPARAGSGYWPGWDITRGIALDPSGGGGLVLDGYGGLHPFGGSALPRGAVPYWSGWDIARGVALTRDSTLARPMGYVLDAFGGVHPFGGAPAVATSGFWPGWDIVRGFALDPAGPGGYVLDGYGALHPFGGAPARATAGYWPGRDIARGVALIGGGEGGRGYVLDGAGAIWRFGGAPNVEPASYWGLIVGRGLSIAP